MAELADALDSKSSGHYDRIGSIPILGTIWPYGQAVKTPPFHGGNPGSNPGRVTNLIFYTYMGA